MFRPWELNTDMTSIIQKDDNNINVNGRGQPINLNDVQSFLMGNGYPGYVSTKNEKSNFRRQSKAFTLQNGILLYKKSFAKVVFDTNERMDILMMIHKGTDDSSEATALSSHRGRDATLRLLKTRFYWPSMTLDAKKYVKECDVCQRVNPATLKVVPEMQPITVPKMVFKQIGIDLITLPEVNSLRYVAVAVDYFSKWCEARALPDKTAKTVARFIYDDIICRHGCPKVEISDQGREFCNNLSKELFHLTGTQHRVTSPYHPQANGLVERLNRTIKNSLLKVHNGNELQWPDVLHGVMFAYRTAQHNSTKYSPFFVLYQRDPVLPVDVKFQSNVDNNVDEYNFCLDFDERTYENTLNSMISMRGIMEDNVHDNILDAQLRQKASYSKRHPQLENIFEKGDEVLLKNLRREDRKGGWVFMPWIGPFIIHDILDKKKCVLSRGGNVLKTKQLISNIKKYYRSKDDEPDNISQYEDHSTVTAIPSDVSLSNNKKYFNPVSLLWMKAKSKQFNFHLPQNPVAKKSKKIHLLSGPKEIISILGDGNCWFRSISLWISGTEEYHSIIRSSLIKAYRENELIKKIIGDVETYISLTGMEENGTWATDIEMMATAIYLNTHIYVYTKTNNTYDWHFFGKSGNYKNGAKKIEQCIYIEHLNANHFQVVKSV